MRHPDLERLGRRMRDHLDDTLDADQHAALAASRRRRTLRDRLIEAEDRAETIAVSTVNGQVLRGLVTAVAVDHITLTEDGAERLAAIAHIVSVDIR